MKRIAFLAALCAAAYGADAPASTTGRVLDNSVRGVEREIVSLAEAMPAEKYGFAPSNGEFSGVRTFAQQITHVAAVNYAVGASVLGEQNPTDMGQSENGPANLKTKDEVVKYLKDSFAYAHKAMASVTDQNSTAMVKSAFGNQQVPRLNMAMVPVWHTFDHYGQMVVYARMNGIVPPASRR